MFQVPSPCSGEVALELESKCKLYNSKKVFEKRSTEIEAKKFNPGRRIKALKEHIIDFEDS